MKLHLFVLLVSTGFAPLVLSISRKYYLIQQLKTWTEAQAFCRSIHTDLATIENNADMIKLQTEAQNHQFSSSAWIGLWNDVNSWRWSLGNISLGSWTDWNPGQPNNGDGHQECAVVNQWMWYDVKCAAKFPFLCFDESQTGDDRYIFISAQKMWSEAQAYCRDFYTDLASARDDTENSVLSQKLGLISNSQLDAWFGLFRDAWKWSDQTITSTVSWGSGQPNNALRNEDCAYINNGLVADSKCSELKPFFCYRAITGEQHFIRMKVQSNQDVNNPAVKATILKQINQRLLDHGMENMVMKWREQPGGVVFHKTEEYNSTSTESEVRYNCEV